MVCPIIQDHPQSVFSFVGGDNVRFDARGRHHDMLHRIRPTIQDLGKSLFQVAQQCF